MVERVDEESIDDDEDFVPINEKALDSFVGEQVVLQIG